MEHHSIYATIFTTKEINTSPSEEPSPKLAKITDNEITILLKKLETSDSEEDEDGKSPSTTYFISKITCLNEELDQLINDLSAMGATNEKIAKTLPTMNTQRITLKFNLQQHVVFISFHFTHN